MTKRIAINGFGRIGRVLFRIVDERKKRGQSGADDLEVVAINDITDPAMLAHLLKYDSVHRRFPGDVKVDGQSIVVDGKPIKIYAEKDPAKLPWKTHEVDVVVESTGLFASKEDCSKHLAAGAKKVMLTAPAKGAMDATICYGINHDKFTKDMSVISTASCTTNCLAPVAKILMDS